MKINVYSTNTCPACLNLKNWLNIHKIPFINYNVATDREAAMYLMSHYGQSVPVIEINGVGVIGFNKPRIEKLIVEVLRRERK